ncbi:hypothetical protein M9458_010740, partial [Cirrhinus mrigala]
PWGHVSSAGRLPLGQVSRRTVSQQSLPSQAGVPSATGMQPWGSRLLGHSIAWSCFVLESIRPGT